MLTVTDEIKTGKDKRLCSPVLWTLLQLVAGKSATQDLPIFDFYGNSTPSHEAQAGYIQLRASETRGRRV